MWGEHSRPAFRCMQSRPSPYPNGTVTALLLLVLKVWKQSAVVSSVLILGTSWILHSLLSQLASQLLEAVGLNSWGHESLGFGHISYRQAGDCMTQAGSCPHTVLTLMADGWWGQGSWDGVWMSRSSELDRIGWNGNSCATCTCMWGWDCDWCFRQSVEAPAAARKAGVFSYLLWAFHTPWSEPSLSVCASHQCEYSFPHVFLFQQLTPTIGSWLVGLDSYMLSLGPTLLLRLAPCGQFWPQCSPKDGKSISYFCWCF